MHPNRSPSCFLSPSPSLRDLALRLAAHDSLLYARMHSVCPSRQHRLPSLLSSPFSSPLPRCLSLYFSPSLSPSLSPHLPPLSLPLSLSIFPSPSCSLPAAVTPRPLLGTDGAGGGGEGVRKFNPSSVPATPISPPPLISHTRKEL